MKTVPAAGLARPAQPFRPSRPASWGRLAGALALASLVGCAEGSASLAPGGGASPVPAVGRLVGEAHAVQGLSPSRWSAQLAAATAQLPAIRPRRLYHSADDSRFYSELELAALPKAARANFIAETVDEESYYYGPLGSPLFYMRLLDIVSENLRANLPGRRILEWNYSSIGPLKLLALQGVQAVGISPSPRLRALYSFPGDQGELPVVEREVRGRLTLLLGSFPAEPAARAAVGGDYDVIIARNILTRGYIHPSSARDATLPAEGAIGPGAVAAIDLGMSDEEFLRNMLAVLKPGGRLLVYNLCPPPPPAQSSYDPHSDCRNPFPQALWQAMGFRVRDYDRSDTTALRDLVRALSPGPLTTPPAVPSRIGTARLNPGELYATYTLVERP